MIGVGTDILKISHLAGKSIEPSDAFTRKVYTAAELKEAMKREIPLYYFATRFAGKEAVFKALGMSSDDARLNDIEILNDKNGQPHVALTGSLAAAAHKRGIARVMISLSYDTEYAVAFAVAE